MSLAPASRRTLVCLAAGLSLLAPILATVGCNKSGGTAAATSSAGVDTALVAAGRTVYANNGCARCHAVDGQGGRSGPDLTRVGGEAEHTAAWLVAHIKNPKAHNPGSRMPSFEGRISDKDLLALGAYLASLK
jgi:cbb3-type cytochrome oxidase cytochrome c subunit